ncbi:hypothetical protein EVA_20341 [gut metagenome]|uniref:Uncharacterized protein n=1 Tax=gut metagenome TaxID=749906 RepID=J9FAW4_9ZZZZ
MAKEKRDTFFRIGNDLRVFLAEGIQIEFGKILVANLFAGITKNFILMTADAVF